MIATMLRRRSILAATATRAWIRRAGLAALTAAVIAASAGCGQTTHPPRAGVGSAAQSWSATQTLRKRPVTLMTAESAYGQILETGSGIAVYYFTKDSRSSSHCLGACTRRWRPLIMKGRIRVAAGVSTALLGHIVRPGGRLQLSYAGHPLYTSSRDTAPGQLNGQDAHAFGGTWLVVFANGKANIQPAPTPTASGGGVGI